MNGHWFEMYTVSECSSEISIAINGMKQKAMYGNREIVKESERQTNIQISKLITESCARVR